MIRPTIVFVALVAFCFSTTPAAAEENYLRFFSDEAGSTCFLNYSDLGVATVHIFQTGPVPSSAVQFSALTPACWTGATWIGDVIPEPNLPLGNSQDPQMGIMVATHGCKTLPVYIGSINHLVTDPSVSCCVYEPGPVEEAETPGTLQYVDCTNPNNDFWVLRPMLASGVVVNQDPSCPCQVPLAVAETTWGQIKALYR